jgi:hypothetical protein
MNHNSVPVIGPDGKAYPSITACAKAMKVSYSTLYSRLETTGSLVPTNKHMTPVRYGRKVYPSIRALARKLGCPAVSLGYHLQTHGNLDRFGLGKAHGQVRITKETRIGGVSFESRKAAAEALGIAYSTLRIWISPDATPAQRDQLAERLLAYRMNDTSNRSAA